MALNIGELEAVLRLREAFAEPFLDIVPISLIVLLGLYTLAASTQPFSRRHFFGVLLGRN